MTGKLFELRVFAEKPDEYGLALFQQRPSAKDRKRLRQIRSGMDWQLVVMAKGAPTKAIMALVLQIIKHAGYRPSDISLSRKALFSITEDAGVRLGILMLSVKPLKKTSRMAEISDRIQSMTEEEAYYWFSKATDPIHGRRAQKALRILLARE